MREKQSCQKVLIVNEVSQISVWRVILCIKTRLHIRLYSSSENKSLAWTKELGNIWRELEVRASLGGLIRILLDAHCSVERFNFSARVWSSGSFTGRRHREVNNDL